LGYYYFDDLAEAVRRRGMLPPGSPENITDDDILAFANEELQSYIVPLVLSVREEYFVAVLDTNVVADQAAYDIPSDAIGLKLRSVQLSNGTGGYYDLPRVEPERVDEYGALGAPQAYYLRANSVMLVPVPTAAGATLRLAYFKRPGLIVGEEGVLPKIPEDLHPLWAQRTLVRVLEALGLNQKQAVAEAAADRLANAAIGVLSQRVQGSSRVVVNRNGPGFRRSRGPRPRW
jgi:hypothetical protein